MRNLWPGRWSTMIPSCSSAGRTPIAIPSCLPLARGLSRPCSMTALPRRRQRRAWSRAALVNGLWWMWWRGRGNSLPASRSPACRTIWPRACTAGCSRNVRRQGRCRRRSTCREDGRGSAGSTQPACRRAWRSRPGLRGSLPHSIPRIWPPCASRSAASCGIAGISPPPNFWRSTTSRPGGRPARQPPVRRLFHPLSILRCDRARMGQCWSSPFGSFRPQRC